MKSAFRLLVVAVIFAFVAGCTRSVIEDEAFEIAEREFNRFTFYARLDPLQFEKPTKAVETSVPGQFAFFWRSKKIGDGGVNPLVHSRCV